MSAEAKLIKTPYYSLWFLVKILSSAKKDIITVANVSLQDCDDFMKALALCHTVLPTMETGVCLQTETHCTRTATNISVCSHHACVCV